MTGLGWLEQTWSVALFGHFNPSITTPAWLSRHGALTELELEDAQSEVDAAAAAINAGGVSLEVTLDRFLVQTSDETQVVRLPEMTTSIFSVLAHTPVSSVAMGFDGEWSAPDEEAQQRILDHLLAGSPPAWAGPPLARSATIRLGGLSGPGAVAHLTLEDSDVATYGVYVSVVDEMTLPDGLEDSGAVHATGVLAERWDAFVKRSRKLADDLIGGVA